MLVQHFTLAATAYSAPLVPAGATGMGQVSLQGTELHGIELPFLLHRGNLLRKVLFPI